MPSVPKLFISMLLSRISNCLPTNLLFAILFGARVLRLIFFEWKRPSQHRFCHSREDPFTRQTMLSTLGKARNIQGMQSPVLFVLILGLLNQQHGFAFSASSPLRGAFATTMTDTILYDMPVSNNGARCRLIIYKKGLTDQVEIKKPSELGGLKSEEFLKRNPQGKMPMLSTPNLDIAESDTIARYLLDKYSEQGPSFQIHNPRSNLMCRIHDIYITTIQGSLYKAAPPFGMFGTRKDAIAELVKQLENIDNLITEEGLYLCGDEVSLADATVFPTMVFCDYMLPKFDVSPALPPKLSRWFDAVSSQDLDFAKIKEEITGALRVWDENGRWEPLLGAGWRDTDPATLFDKIVAGHIPATIVEQPDDKVLAFKDIHPAAPVHVLVIPKDRNGLTRISQATAEHTEILGRLMVRTPSTMSTRQMKIEWMFCKLIVEIPCALF